MNETEILHGQHIVQELLEILIDSNHLDLEICEVEGDAIFFYRLGNKLDLQSLLGQVEKMFTRFHQYLKLYEHQRICNCGACQTAVQLSLKVVVHFGEVTGIAVKDHKKLFGKDVILLHRLLKNTLDKKEYVLLTDSVTKNLHRSEELPDWYNPTSAMEQYDVGSVQFLFSDLSILHNRISIKAPERSSFLQTYVGFTQEEIITKPMQKIFEAILTLQQHAKLREKTKKLEITDDELARIGTKHYCLITKNSNVNVIESVKVQDEKIELVEMSTKGIAGYRYVLTKISDMETKLSIQMLIKNNPIFKLGFSLVVKPKMVKRVKQFFQFLRNYVERVSLQPNTP